jgi:hypothetical protein
MITKFTTKSFPLNELQWAAEDWNYFYPERAVWWVASHADKGINFGFAYASDAETITDFSEWVEEELEGGQGYPGGEAARGWANIHNEEMEKIARQNLEDAEYARQYPPVSYMGVVGRREPDGGYIFEP